VVRYTPSTGASSVEVTDPDVTLFGVRGSGPDDVWTVGGDIRSPADAAQVWRWDGAAAGSSGTGSAAIRATAC
jgi:hypothetical protein